MLRCSRGISRIYRRAPDSPRPTNARDEAGDEHGFDVLAEGLRELEEEEEDCGTDVDPFSTVDFRERREEQRSHAEGKGKETDSRNRQLVGRSEFLLEGGDGDGVRCDAESSDAVWWTDEEITIESVSTVLAIARLKDKSRIWCSVPQECPRGCPGRH